MFSERVHEVESSFWTIQTARRAISSSTPAEVKINQAPKYVIKQAETRSVQLPAEPEVQIQPPANLNAIRQSVIEAQKQRVEMASDQQLAARNAIVSDLAARRAAQQEGQL